MMRDRIHRVFWYAAARPARKSAGRCWLWSAAIAVAMIGCGSPLSAQTYTPIAVVPSPDVYAYMQQNPSVQGLFGSQTRGQFTSLTVFGDSYADWGNAVRAGQT